MLTIKSFNIISFLCLFSFVHGLIFSRLLILPSKQGAELKRLKIVYLAKVMNLIVFVFVFVFFFCFFVFGLQIHANFIYSTL